MNVLFSPSQGTFMPVDPRIANDLSIGQVNQEAIDRNAEFRTRIIPRTRRDNVVTKVENWRQGHNGAERLVFPRDRPKYFMTLDMSEYESVSGQNVKFNSKGTIVLPMPGQMIDGHEIRYSEEELGLLVGAGVNFLSKNVEGGTKDLGETVDQVQQNIQAEAQAQSQSGVGAILTNIGAGLIGADKVSDAVFAFLGQSPNQFLTILLKGPAYKRYQLNWKLAPKDFEEAEIIRKILITLNNAMAPGVTAGGTVFTFPRIFWLAYRPNHNYLYRFKPSVLYNMQVNYAPGGVPAFYHDDQNGAQPGGAYTGQGNNPPEAVEITAQFLELEFWLKGDFLDGGGPFAVRGPRGP
jgi:hypothetical protein